MQDEPSGACPLGVVPTGEWTCTYTYQKVGELRISALAMPCQCKEMNASIYRGDIENISSLETFLEGSAHCDCACFNQVVAVNMIRKRTKESGDLDFRLLCLAQE